MADGQLLWRVLENLLGNVSKYALPGSRVYLDISSESALQYMLTAGAVMPRRLANEAEPQSNLSAEAAAELAKQKKG